MRRQLLLQRFNTSEARAVQRILKRSLKDIIAQLDRIAALPAIARTRETQRQSTRLKKILADIKVMNDDVGRGLRDRARKTLVELSKQEIDAIDRILNDTVGVNLDNYRPSPDILRELATQNLMNEQSLTEWYSKLTRDRFTKLRGVIESGLVQGQTLPQMTEALMALDGSTLRSAETLIRTSHNHVANAAREKMYDANRDIIKGMEWTSTLDSRTSLICASRDGHVVAYPGETVAGPKLKPAGARPPAHPNCRSVMTPILKTWDELAGPNAKIKPRNKTTSFNTLYRKELAAQGLSPEEIATTIRDRRASFGSKGRAPIAQKNKFLGWFDRQKPDFQKKNLGAARYDLYKQGVAIPDMVTITGRPLNLDELREATGKHVGGG
jgi:SPP1 gp7 family putative phage head morphogenesis protein